MWKERLVDGLDLSALSVWGLVSLDGEDAVVHSNEEVSELLSSWPLEELEEETVLVNEGEARVILDSCLVVWVFNLKSVSTEVLRWTSYCVVCYLR